MVGKKLKDAWRASGTTEAFYKGGGEVYTVVLHVVWLARQGGGGMEDAKQVHLRTAARRSGSNPQHIAALQLLYQCGVLPAQPPQGIPSLCCA